MLVKPTMESLLKKISSRYILTILAAKRARQLVDGAQPMAKSDTPNLVTTACEEIGSGAVVAARGIHTVTVPLRPEVEAERLREELEKRNARYREELEEEGNSRIRSLVRVIEANDDDYAVDETIEDIAEEIVDDDFVQVPDTDLEDPEVIEALGDQELIVELTDEV